LDCRAGLAGLDSKLMTTERDDEALTALAALLLVVLLQTLTEAGDLDPDGGVKLGVEV
jgi:hypothetical protein